MGKKLLAVISSDRRIKDFLVNTLEKVIGLEVEIQGYSFDEGVSGPKTADLVLTSGSYSVQQAKLIFPNSPIVPSKRVITGYNLEQVMMLPKGKKVLVVNNPRSVSEETIENLKSLGINHLDYIPYWKGEKIDTDEIDTAISPGMLHICPENIKHTIDIGARTITIQTFVEVLLKLNLSVKYVNVFENSYNKLLIDAANKIRKVLNQSEKLRKNQTVILDEIEEGILSVDERNQLIFANPAMNKIFGNHPDLMANKNILEIIKNLESAEIFPEKSGDTEKSLDLLYSLPNKKVVCNRNMVQIGGEKSYIYTFREAAQIQKLEQKVRIKLYEKGYVAKHSFEDIWGDNQQIKTAKKMASIFAGTEETILITGESGTGKELFAQAIHCNSRRSDGPFVAMNFAAIPEGLVESELFGYEEGAFTGARKGGKQGIFELAHGGTLLLDEIGDAPLNIQARLLRVLEEREIMRLGGARMIPVDVRVIAATNQNLVDYVKRKLFRADLFYRLSVLTLEIPPLREFREEIPLFLEKLLQAKYNLKRELKPEVLAFLLKYDWPGNMRELRNVADYMYYSFVGDNRVGIDNIPGYLKKQLQVNLGVGRNESLSKIVTTLQKAGDLEEIQAALAIFYSDGNVGRTRLVERMTQQGLKFTENKAKKYLRLLESLELVVVGKTRQGSSLTGFGRELHCFLSAPKECP